MTTSSVSPSTFDPLPILVSELSLPRQGVSAVLRLFEEKATIPFIARYRKEATGGLDEVQIRAVQERHTYLVELDKRRQAIVEAIDSDGKLTKELTTKLFACATKAELEDLYLPFKKRRRTRATMARERGLEPLAKRILDQPSSGSPIAEAEAFVDAERGVPDASSALAGAQDIIAEQIAERAEFRAMLREHFAKRGAISSSVVKDKATERTKFEQYYDYSEPVTAIPSHRYLAIRRGEREGILRGRIEVDAAPLLTRIAQAMGYRRESPFAETLQSAVEDAFKRLLAPSIENDVRGDLKTRSDREAVDVFARNLRNLLLAAPLGTRSVLGVDPGLRTGCKCAAVDDTGQYLSSGTIFPHTRDKAKARNELSAMVRRHHPAAIAVGNGTAGRETESFVRSTLKELKFDGEQPAVVLVNESGASVYSASDVAREEFPDLDLTVRGAISIARRLQDPLAELVKIDPKSIGVGQYQHDVHQPLLKQKLSDVVESCVNHVGVELNTASPSLLGHVAGIGPKLATTIVDHRNTSGPFAARRELLKVAGLGPKTFEQCAGFLRIKDGKQPLDASAVHPERYALVKRMASDQSVSVNELLGNEDLISRIDISRYMSDDVGEPTLRDIIDELRKPGRDPRDTFEPSSFREDVQTLEDLVVGMRLNGVVTNVTHFGAFVDIGVHQDGLVHISQLADRFVRDPHDVVQVGQSVNVRVLDVDLDRKRIGLSCRSDSEPPRSSRNEKGPKSGQDSGARRPRQQTKPPRKAQRKSEFRVNPFADLLKKKR